MPKHLVIVAGEESGDMHAATLVRELKAEQSDLITSGIGGKHMQAAGVQLISDLAQYGVTGLTEVIRHGWTIKKAFTAIKLHLLENKPDLLILVDYPGFNLRLAKYAKKLGIRIVYYISPQIWAWKANRIKTIQACVDKMAVILPFEKNMYEQAGVPVSFVGHPLIDKIKSCQRNEKSRSALNLPTDKRIIAMLPGSRVHEIERHMPILLKTAEKLHRQTANLHFVIPIASSLPPALIESYFSTSSVNISFIQGKATEVIACSDFAIVASGTASLECALLEKPMCIIYKSSLLSYIVAVKLIKVRYLGLCNLLQNKMIVPELLQYDCNSEELAYVVNNLLNDSDLSLKMINRLKLLKHSLSAEQADSTLVQLIKDELAFPGKFT